MNVFVTGGSGFVGGHVIEGLAGAHRVLAMARSERSASVVEGFGAEAVRCSLDDIHASHLEGVDVVVHGAAYVEEYGPDSAYENANVGGTQRLLDAARAAGVKRFILVSSNATVFDGTPQDRIDETVPHTTLARFPYGRTKAEAERRVRAANREGFTTLSLRPCFVWGPRDNSVGPAVARMAEEGSFVWVDGGKHRISTTHVDNLVAAVRLALTEGRGGEAYFVTDGEDTDFRTFLSQLARDQGVELQGPNVPGWLVRGLGSGLDVTWRTLGRSTPPPLTRMASLLMSTSVTVRTDKIRSELGWAPVHAAPRA